MEVAFSPTDQINDDIIAELGNFNIGEYIGDPRHISESRTNYPDLDTLRNSYFTKYIKSYNIKDFIRLIKFFDNSLFKMIKDFTPARTNLSSGVVVKQHLLERNAYSPLSVIHEDETYSGSIKSFARGYNTGSDDVINSNAESGSSIEVTKGGTVGMFERFSGLIFSPSGSNGDGPNNRFDITQSWSDVFPSITGKVNYARDDQREFFNGEFSQSSHVKFQRGLNLGNDDPCYEYTNWENVPDLQYRLEFLSGSDEHYRIEDYTPPPPITGTLFERSYSGSSNAAQAPEFPGGLPPLPGVDACLNVSTESIFFNHSNTAQIVSGSIAYSTASLEQTFDGSDGNGNSLWWAVKASGSQAGNEKRLLIDENGGVENYFLCRTIRNAVLMYSSSGNPGCYNYTLMNLGSGGQTSQFSYISCSGLPVTETFQPNTFETRCVLSGSTVTVDSGPGTAPGGFVQCQAGSTTIHEVYAAVPEFPLSEFLTYNVSGQTGCWYYSASVSLADTPTTTVTSQCGLVIPTTSSNDLAYHSFSKIHACAAGYSYYYTDSSLLHLMTEIYSDQNGTYAASGWYSNGTIARYWNGNGSLGAVTSCTAGGGTGNAGGTGVLEEITEEQIP